MELRPAAVKTGGPRQGLQAVPSLTDPLGATNLALPLTRDFPRVRSTKTAGGLTVSFLKEPVFHFALLGVALFVYFNMTADETPGATAENELIVEEPDVEQVIGEYSALWRRPPTADELDGLINAQIREEVLVREALALGLDRNDAVIRNRLRQKMQFLMESAAQSMQPTEADLQAYLDDNIDRFRKAGSVAFQQVLVEDGVTDSDIAATLDALNSGASPIEVGQRTLLPAALPLTPLQQTDGMFGRGFSDGLRVAETGIWSGPVVSGYGQHLVRVTERVEARVPELSEIRDKVALEWKQTQAKDLAEAQVKALMQGYDIQRPDDAALTRILTQ